MKVESDHLESQTHLLTQIRDLIDAGQRRVQPDMRFEAFNVNASGLNVIVPGVPGNRIFVYAVSMVAAGAVTATWGSSQGTTFRAFTGPASSGNTGDQALAANGGIAYATTFPGFLFRTEPEQALALNLGSSVLVGGYVSYWSA